MIFEHTGCAAVRLSRNGRFQSVSVHFRVASSLDHLKKFHKELRENGSVKIVL